MALDRSIAPCPECYRADDVQPPTLDPDGNLLFVCTDGHGGLGHVAFVRIAEASPVAASRGGSTRRLDTRKTDDLLDPLRSCVRPGEGWVEYGVVEHRLRTVAPQIFARHVAEAGHVVLGPRASTASGVCFAMALRRLADGGELEGTIRRSTGAAWRHDSTISFWRAVPEGPDAAAQQTDAVLTWVDHCRQLGRSDDWIDEDRHGLVGPDPASGG